MHIRDFMERVDGRDEVAVDVFGECEFTHSPDYFLVEPRQDVTLVGRGMVEALRCEDSDACRVNGAVDLGKCEFDDGHG